MVTGWHWLYEQRTGKIYRKYENGFLICRGTGWAGQDNANGKGKNNPDLESVGKTGPLPCGWYTIGDPHDSPHTGPYTMDLTPDPENEMFGRSLFRMHGPAVSHPELSSEGCIVLIRSVREQVHESGLRRLEVVADAA